MTRLEHITVDATQMHVDVQFTPTIPHCSMVDISNSMSSSNNIMNITIELLLFLQATLIGLSIRVMLIRSLPPKYKIDVSVRKGTHQSEVAVNKQLKDKERVSAALENIHLLEVVNQCLLTTIDK